MSQKLDRLCLDERHGTPCHWDRCPECQATCPEPLESQETTKESEIGNE